VYWEDPLPERPGLPPPELKAAHFEKIYPATARVDMAAPPTRPSAAGVRPVIVDREATQKIDRETVRKPVSPQATTEWSASVESRKPPISSPGGPVNDRIIAAAAVVALLVAVLIFILPVSAWVRFALIALVAAIAILGWRFWGGQGGSGMTRF
jgi:hypothetical protein